MPTLEIDVKALHPAQQQVASEAKRFNVLCAGRRFGKNELAVHLIIECALRGSPVGYFAPTNPLLSDAWRELSRVLTPVTVRKREDEHRLEFIGGGRLECWSLEAIGAGRGRKYRRVIIDEAATYSKLESAFNEDIRPTLTDLRGDAWFLSTPRGRNAFWRYFRQGQSPDHPDWMSWQFPSAANPHLPDGEVESARRSMPERAYGQEYLGLFIEETGGVFRNIDASIDRGRKEASIITDRALQFSLGVDVARHNDYTVLTILDNRGVQHYHERFREVSWPRQIAAIVRATKVLGEIAEKSRPPGSRPLRVSVPTILLDTTGVGDVVYDALSAKALFMVRYTFTYASRRRLMDNCASMLENGRLRLMDIREQEEELIAYEYTTTPAGNVVMSAPEGSNDDCVCALALAAWGVRSDCYVDTIGAY
jgi:hypothetical protein